MDHDFFQRVRLIPAAIFFPLLYTATTVLAEISIDWVSVGDPSNPPDSQTGLGAVDYEYRIAKYEITLAQWTAFLNAAAKSDPHGLFHLALDPDKLGLVDLNVAGITRQGTQGAFSYSVVGDPQRPVTYVSWFDAARFANWLHNEQPSNGSGTETGAYALHGSTDEIISRNSDAKFWIPSADEWYKSAYYDPTRDASMGEKYWSYPTRSDDSPDNKLGSGLNQANYRRNSIYSVTQNSTYLESQNYLSAVGAFTGSESFYGTCDQGGNVWEWIDVDYGFQRGRSGGGWSSGWDGHLQARTPAGTIPTATGEYLGFRLAAAAIASPSLRITSFTLTSTDDVTEIALVVEPTKGLPLSESLEIEFSESLDGQWIAIGTIDLDGDVYSGVATAPRSTQGFVRARLP